MRSKAADSLRLTSTSSVKTAVQKKYNFFVVVFFILSRHKFVVPFVRVLQQPHPVGAHQRALHVCAVWPHGDQP